MKAKRIAYVDHSYHKKTRSTAFLSDILIGAGHHVDLFWDDAWQGGQAVPWTAVSGYDVVIMFQSFTTIPANTFGLSHPNVIYIPMLDQFGLWTGPQSNSADFWSRFYKCKIINFSSTLHHVVLSHGLISHFSRYYRQPIEEKQVDGLHGFFWLRRDDLIPWAVIRELIGSAQFDTFHIHMARDPSSPKPVLPTDIEIARHNITISTWFEDKEELSQIINKANVYFAPRPEEGIGQSYLEAMASSKCVVAADHGTMNEYIVHGLNGLLYDLKNPRPLSFDNIMEIGRMAKQSSDIGYTRWCDAQNELVKFVITPTDEVYQPFLGRINEPKMTYKYRKLSIRIKKFFRIH